MKHEILGGLFEECPMWDELPTCPFVSIRNKTIDQQIQMVEAMTNEELEDLIALHKSCICNRAQKTRGFKLVRDKKSVAICQV
ncbi:MAG: hypothetical protein C0594_09025 [Marinilabiliales bacterium]|nr:MAG: hypothetical protein C0594_09025 [Marinilabiliales bacterium]